VMLCVRHVDVVSGRATWFCTDDDEEQLAMSELRKHTPTRSTVFVHALRGGPSFIALFDRYKV
jgi:hypothetical protein